MPSLKFKLSPGTALALGEPFASRVNCGHDMDRTWHRIFSGWLLACLFWANQPLAQALEAPPANPPFRAEKLAAIDAAVTQAIHDKHLPGGVLWLGCGTNSYHRPYGLRAVEPREEIMTQDTLFDAASLTKVLATTPCILWLIEQGKIQLDAPASTYLPEFGTRQKEKITVRHLLTHTSGLRSGLSRSPAWSGYDTAIQMACAETPTFTPGTAFRYSDINFIVLGEIAHRVSGLPLNELARQKFYLPLQMPDTGYLPTTNLWPRIAPTERIGGRCLRGVVHDPTARGMGGVAGHAGVFTTAADLARFSRMMLNGGELDGVRVLAPATVKLMTTVQSPAESKVARGLGWDIDSAYAGPRGKSYPVGSYGHSGWTGTSLWIDPASQSFIIFLSNRNHPTEDGNILPLRVELGTLAAEALANFSYSTNTGKWPPGEDKPKASPGTASK